MTSTQWLAYGTGTLKTVELTALSVVFGLILGLFLALARISKLKLLNYISALYIWIFRGTPLLLQIFIIYFSLPSIGIVLDPFPSAVLAFALNSAAYMAEIIRAAILSIDKGQMEAAKALGMNYHQAMFRIIIPQSYRRLLPPLGNEFIMLLKDSSLVSAIGMVELMKVSRNMTNSSGGSMAYYLLAGAIYLALTSVLTYVFQKLEGKYSIYE